MAEYMILIYEDEASWVDAGPEQWEEVGRQHNVFTQATLDMGVRIVTSHALQPTATATSVRGDTVTDGPFVETKEAFGGYYLIDAADLDQALAVAKMCPAGTGGVEVRPILDTSNM